MGVRVPQRDTRGTTQPEAFTLDATLAWIMLCTSADEVVARGGDGVLQGFERDVFLNFLERHPASSYLAA